MKKLKVVKSVSIDQDLHRKFKIYCANKDSNISKEIEKMIKKILEEN